MRVVKCKVRKKLEKFVENSKSYLYENANHKNEKFSKSAFTLSQNFVPYWY